MIAPRVRLQSAFHVGALSKGTLMAVAKAGVFWSVAGGLSALYFVEKVPFIQKDIFSPLPVIGRFWPVPEEE
ncbi:hypothetical protein IWQ61_004246 [Dispira simplex]|nr:hypothetical protein IWQ61_004246 [Dispira simplex]